MHHDSCSCPAALDRCDRCDVLLCLPGFHLLTVEDRDARGLVLQIESCDPVTGCPGCGVIATGHDHRDRCTVGWSPCAFAVAETSMDLPRGLD